MSINSIQAEPHVDGNRIDIAWDLSEDAAYDGMRIVRKEGAYPEHPDDGQVLVPLADELSFSDTGLRAEQMYYYTAFPYQGDPAIYDLASIAKVAAVATAPHGFPEIMHEWLPAIYHRYDKDREFLQRFLSIVGGQFDQFYSLARFSRQLHKVRNTPGELLPALADWIGWKTDYKRTLDAQRDEIQNAPAIYKAVELIPTVEATIKRISGWESRSKEFVHNIFTANRPAQLNLWSKYREGVAAWSETESLLSLDFAYEGRPSTAVDQNGIRRLFYHTERQGSWSIWFKTTMAYELSISLLELLQDGIADNEVLSGFSDVGVNLSQSTTITSLSANVWQVDDGVERYIMQNELQGLFAYHITADATELAASRPLIVTPEIAKHPSPVIESDVLWLFWSEYDAENAHWQLSFRQYIDAQWSLNGPDTLPDNLNPFIEGGVYDSAVQRRYAYAVSDSSGGLWLFWSELNGSVWQLRYNRRTGGAWGNPVTMPLDGGLDPKVTKDIQVLIPPASPDQRIYVFWSRQAETTTPGVYRWQLAYRVKEDWTLNDANWTAVQALAKPPASDRYHDKEPYAVMNENLIEVFWSSNRDENGWSIWRATLDDYISNSWSAVTRISDGQYEQRNALPITLGADTWLLYNSNKHLHYNSQAYRATETFDERFAGSLTLDTRHTTLLSSHQKFEDSIRYTYDTGENGERNDLNWIARDTIGAYLDASTLDEAELFDGIERLRPVVKEFIPFTDRVAFIPGLEIHTDYVYDYSKEPDLHSNYIGSSYSDEFVDVVSESMLPDGEDFFSSLEP